MTLDSQYQKTTASIPERSQKYGERIHLVDDSYLITLTAELSKPTTTQPRLNELLRDIYCALFHLAANRFLEKKQTEIKTRMAEFHDEGVFSGYVIDPEQSVVLVDLARAGILPSAYGFDFFCHFLNPAKVRNDHIFIARKTNDANEVIGVDVAGSKIGGSVEGATLIIPDPMLATGGSIKECIEIYRKRVEGTPKKVVVISLMATPEGIQNLLSFDDQLEIMAVRLDRGLSSDKALKSEPGSFPHEEKGLNKHQYIVPGAGGLGELINNAFV